MKHLSQHHACKRCVERGIWASAVGDGWREAWWYLPWGRVAAMGSSGPDFTGNDCKSVMWVRAGGLFVAVQKCSVSYRGSSVWVA